LYIGKANFFDEAQKHASNDEGEVERQHHFYSLEKTRTLLTNVHGKAKASD
jgi:hypothetical protein